MTTTMKEMLNALATLLGANTYNDYLDARQPVPVRIQPTPEQRSQRR